MSRTARVVLAAEERSYVEFYGVPLYDRRAYYIAALEPDSLLPDPDELEQIKSYIEYKATSFYSEDFAAKLLTMPFPGDAGHNTVVLRKGHHLGAEGWFCKRFTWEGFGWPNPALSGFRPHALVETLDHVETLHEPPKAWLRWKTSHREFTGLSTTPPGRPLRRGALAEQSVETAAHPERLAIIAL